MAGSIEIIEKKWTFVRCWLPPSNFVRYCKSNFYSHVSYSESSVKINYLQSALYALVYKRFNISKVTFYFVKFSFFKKNYCLPTNPIFHARLNAKTFVYTQNSQDSLYETDTDYHWKCITRFVDASTFSSIVYGR